MYHKLPKLLSVVGMVVVGVGVGGGELAPRKIVGNTSRNEGGRKGVGGL